MKVVPLKKARLELGALVRGHQAVLISDRGKIVAQLLPLGGKRRPILDIAGIVQGPGDGSLYHDRYLYEVRKRK